MKTKVFAIFLILTVLIFSGINHSCNKDKDLPSHVEKQENPFKAYGKIHNSVLNDFLISNKEVIGKSTFNPKQILAGFKKSYEKVTNNTLSTKDCSNDSLALEYINFILKNPNVNEMYDYMNNNGMMNDAVKEKMQSLSNAIMSISADTDSLYYIEANNLIKNFETEILYNNNLNQKDKEDVLKLTAVAEASCDFWYSNKNIYFNNTSSKISWLGIFTIVAADAATLPVFWMTGVASGAFFIAIASTEE